MDSLARGIAASAFDPDAADAEAILASVAPNLDSRKLRERIRSCRRDACEDRIMRPAPDNRIEALRNLLQQRQLDGCLVPLTDEYHGEFIPPAARRLEWLTGFGGSAGLAIVLAQKAAIFVDGRYTLQVRDQVNTGIFVPHEVPRIRPGSWLCANAKPGSRIGYDPWLHTRSDLETLAKECRGSGVLLSPLDSNPVDALWTDRPALPLGPVMLHDIRHAGVGVEEKRQLITDIIGRSGCDAVLLTLPESVAWLLNVRGCDIPHTPVPLGRAIVTRDAGIAWFIDSRKIATSVSDALPESTSIYEPDALPSHIETLGAESAIVLVDRGQTPERLHDALETAGVTIRTGDDPCILPKATKNETELEGARACHVRDGAALCEFLAWLASEAPGGTVTEQSAAARLLEFRKSDPHFRGTSFDTISGSGPNGAIVHYRVTDQTNRRLRTNDVYLVDSGGQYVDGTTDVTRTVYIGGDGAADPAPEIRDRFTRVLKGHIAIATARFPVGTGGAQLDSLARLALWNAGLDYDHGTGHGVGSYLGVHEGPQRISKGADTVELKPGMIISNEPGYYKPGSYGIRTENLVIVQAMEAMACHERSMLCFETITLAPIDRMLIAVPLLTSDEKRWLNDYHERVRTMISPLVGKAARAWLERATQEI